MEMSTRQVGSFYVLHLSGRIDQLRHAITLKSEVNQQVDKGVRDIALNLEKISFLDSGALNVIIYCHNVLKDKGGKITLIAPNAYVTDVLEVVGLSKLLTIYKTEKEFAHACASA